MDWRKQIIFFSVPNIYCQTWSWRCADVLHVIELSQTEQNLNRLMYGDLLIIIIRWRKHVGLEGIFNTITILSIYLTSWNIKDEFLQWSNEMRVRCLNYWNIQTLYEILKNERHLIPLDEFKQCLIWFRCDMKLSQRTIPLIKMIIKCYKLIVWFQCQNMFVPSYLFFFFIQFYLPMLFSFENMQKNKCYRFLYLVLLFN